MKSESFTKPITPVDKTLCIALPDRGLTKASCEFYGIWVNARGEQVYPYYDQEGLQHVANKFRVADRKGFMVQQAGDTYNKSGLFGQQLFPPGSAKYITIVEGELDAPSAYQMMGSKWPVVSVKSASEAQKNVADSFRYLNSFETVVICFDKDEPHIKPDGSAWYPGQEAAAKVAGMFPLGKVKILTLSKGKDANDYLRADWSEQFIKEWWKAPVFTPDGIREAADMWDIVLAAKNTKYKAIPYPWVGLQELTYGLRLSELVTITANPKVGKTSILREIVWKILNTAADPEDVKRVGMMFLEEPNKDTLMGLMSLCANKPLHLPDILEQVDEGELKTYFDNVYGNRQVMLWDHFGSNSVDKVLDYVRYMHNLGCKYIVLDHLSIIVSDQHGDERKQLDEIATKLKMLTMELGICVICVIHQNRAGQIRGTQGVEQLSNIVLKLYRDHLNEDPEVRNILKVVVEYNRFSGKTGPACVLRYDAETGRLAELTPEEAKLVATGDAKNEW